MMKEIVKFLPEYKVLVCTLCKERHCIPLKGLADHLHDFHKEVLSKKQRRELIKYGKTFQSQLIDPKKIRESHESGRAVTELHKINGYECMTCQKLLGTELSIRIHCRIHGWDSMKPIMWRRSWIQVSMKLKLLINMIDFL